MMANRQNILKKMYVGLLCASTLSFVACSTHQELIAELEAEIADIYYPEQKEYCDKNKKTTKAFKSHQSVTIQYHRRCKLGWSDYITVFTPLLEMFVVLKNNSLTTRTCTLDYSYDRGYPNTKYRDSELILIKIKPAEKKMLSIYDVAAIRKYAKDFQSGYYKPGSIIKEYNHYLVKLETGSRAHVSLYTISAVAMLRPHDFIKRNFSINTFKCK